MDVHGWKVNVIRVERARRHDFFNLDNASLTSCCDGGVKIAGSFAELNVARLVSTPCFNQRVVAGQRLLKNVFFAVVFAFLARNGWNHGSGAISSQLDWEASCLDQGANASGSKESRNSSTTRSTLLCKSTLRYQLDLQLTVEVLSLELFVLTNV